MSVVTWIHEFNAAPAGALPPNVFRYVLGTSGLHQLFLLALTVGVFLLEVVPLELSAGSSTIWSNTALFRGWSACARSMPASFSSKAGPSWR
jgi:hypothetical protein